MQMQIEIGWQDGGGPMALPKPYCTPRHTLVERKLCEMAANPVWCRDITPETRLVAPPAAKPRFKRVPTRQLHTALSALALVIDEDIRKFERQVAGIPFNAIVNRLWAHVLEGGLVGAKTQLAIDHGSKLIVPTTLTRQERANPDLFEVPDLMPARLTKPEPDTLRITLPGVRATDPLAKAFPLNELPMTLLVEHIYRSLTTHPRSAELEAWMQSVTMPQT